MASTADFRNGLVIEMDGQLFQMVYFQHVKPGKGGAFVRTKLKNIRTGAVLERTFNAGERVSDVRLERRAILVVRDLAVSVLDASGHGAHRLDHQPIRRILPPVGMIDFSPLVAWLVLSLLRSFLLSLL